jgi:DNA-binding transcriptional ArsR family regulator
MTDVIRLDAESLKVLAHPVRSRILTALRLHGPATATDLAGRLDTNTGATSYHLRRLESVGLVADSGTGVGKRRVWEPSTRSHEWHPSDFEGDRDAEESLAWLTQHYVGEQAQRARTWLEHEREWPREWRDALGYADDGVVVTATQAAELFADLEALFARYREAGRGDPGARRLLAGVLLTPVEPRYDGGS